jgi:pectate lyase
VSRRLLPAAALALAATVAACGDAKLYPYLHPPVPKDCPSTFVGYAAVGGEVDGVATPPTTGGGDLPPMIVKDPVALAAALQQPNPLVIQIDGMLAPTDTIQVTLDRSAPNGNKTLIGVGASSGLTGAGLDLSYSYNIIIRNLKIAKVSIGEGDAITVLASHHIWIDHCDLSSDRTDTTTGYDGLVDITHGSSFITVSWTMFHDHKDASLVGHTADATAMAEDANLKVTYHHNGFFKVNSGPRVRWGFAHVFNNRFQDVTSFGVVSQSTAVVQVDHNIFESVTLPIGTTYGTEATGTMTETGNKYEPAFTPDILRPTTAPPVLPYSFTPDDVESAEGLVPSCAGTGKINLP